MNKTNIVSTCFLDEEHNYFDIKTKEKLNVKSVTELVGLVYPFDYSKIKPEILEAAQRRGICVHSRLETYIKNKEITYCEHNIKSHDLMFTRAKIILEKMEYNEIYSEISLYNEFYSGTFDLLIINNNEIKMFDFKTSSRPNREKELLQMTLYAKLLEETYGLNVDRFGVINPNIEQYYTFTKGEEEIQNQNYQSIIEKIS